MARRERLNMVSTVDNIVYASRRRPSPAAVTVLSTRARVIPIAIHRLPAPRSADAHRTVRSGTAETESSGELIQQNRYSRIYLGYFQALQTFPKQSSVGSIYAGNYRVFGNSRNLGSGELANLPLALLEMRASVATYVNQHTAQYGDNLSPSCWLNHSRDLTDSTRRDRTQ